MRRILYLLIMLTISASIASAKPYVFEQVISHENPRFDPVKSTLTIGRDGKAYLVHNSYPSVVLRVDPSTSAIETFDLPKAVRNATADTSGNIATANLHFARSLYIYDSERRNIGESTDFLAGDEYSWSSPLHVEAGLSGDFYAPDHHRNQVRRVSKNGQLIELYPLKAEDEPDWPRTPLNMRVHEASQTFTWQLSNLLIRTDTQGREQWRLQVPIDHYSGGYDVDDQGHVLVIGRHDPTVRTYDNDGQLISEVTLKVNKDTTPANEAFDELRVLNNQLVIGRKHPFELFAIYDRATGDFVKSISIDHDQLTVQMDSEIWTAGEQLGFKIDFRNQRDMQPIWRIWIRRWEDTNYRELTWHDGKLQVPTDMAGLYLLKVSPEIQPIQSDQPSPYIAQTLVEIRQPDTHGSINVLTPLNRIHYSRGETIPFEVNVRTAEASMPSAVTITLDDGQQIIASQTLPLASDSTSVSSQIMAAVTEQLKPGRYRLRAERETGAESESSNLTSVDQSIVIGDGRIDESQMSRLWYGDYNETFVFGQTWARADRAEKHVDRLEKMHVNRMVDRLGNGRFQFHLRPYGEGRDRSIQATATRLEKDPLAIDPAYVEVASTFGHTMAQYSATGIDQMSILMYMDAGLPVGTGWDKRTMDELKRDIKFTTESMQSYRAFRGWSWTANWWVTPRGAKSATDDEREAFDEAVKQARETGQWAPIIDTVSDRYLGYNVEAQSIFNDTLNTIVPGLTTATSGPYRRLHNYPPITYSNVDEVDLHLQAEQNAPFNYAPHNVDYQKRPGKPAWSHPEFRNELGTGEQILPTLFAQIMRGVDGIGTENRVPLLETAYTDPRSANERSASIFRTINTFADRYGPWLRALNNNDRVAIVVSGRMARLDIRWINEIGGYYHNRLFEAYQVLLYGHHPASFVFAEELNEHSLDRFDVIMVVNQEVTFEPELAAALTKAKASGKTIFADGTCRPELVADFTPLDVSFDQIEKLHLINDDTSHWTVPATILSKVSAIREKLDQAIARVCRIDQDQVYASEFQSGDARVLFAVNNTITPHTPEQLWRVSNGISTRQPVTANLQWPVQLPARGVVYDLMAMQPIHAYDGRITADLRHLPAAVYVALPTRITNVELRHPEQAVAGQNVAWSINILGSDGQPIQAGLPVELQLLDAEGLMIERLTTTAHADHLQWVTRIPVNAIAGDWRLQATELISGLQTTSAIRITPATLPLAWTTDAEEHTATKSAVDTDGVGLNNEDKLHTTRDNRVSSTVRPTQQSAGPRLRDMVVAGESAYLTAFNHDGNVYALDITNGQTRWIRQVGDYFAYEPTVVGNNLAIQRFDFTSASGYHLQRLDHNGNEAGSLAANNVTGRQIHWAYPAKLYATANRFASSPDGTWYATTGNLGLSVLNRDGSQRWSKDWRNNSTPPQQAIAAMGTNTLVIGQDMALTAHDAHNGDVLWSLELPGSGRVEQVIVSGDQQTLAVRTSAGRGMIFIINQGKVVREITSGGNAIALSHDGNSIAITLGYQLHQHTLEQGLRWVFHGDDNLLTPTVCPQTGRIAVGSSLGTLYVFDADGNTLLEQDVEAAPIVQWLPNGDLMYATWNGRVVRLNLETGPVWETDVRNQPNEPVPTVNPEHHQSSVKTISRQTIAHQAKSNLLAHDNTRILFLTVQGQNNKGNRTIRNQVNHERTALLTDGDPTPPTDPWFSSSTVYKTQPGSWINELHIEIDRYNTLLRVDRLTIVEDPQHPESWLRNVMFEYWDASTEQWQHAARLVSDSAVHHHKLDKPIKAARFRLRLLSPIGNVRTAEIIFQGQELGSSHPDVVDRKSTAMLFDEIFDSFGIFRHPKRDWQISTEQFFHGAHSMVFSGEANSLQRAPYTQKIANWKFKITEHPKLGEYRYARFAWKALSNETKGITLQLTSGRGGGAGMHVGQAGGVGNKKSLPLGDTPPHEWKVETVDLYQIMGGPLTIESMTLDAIGGQAAFDWLHLGRTRNDLLNP